MNFLNLVAFLVEFKKCSKILVEFKKCEILVEFQSSKFLKSYWQHWVCC